MRRYHISFIVALPNIVRRIVIGSVIAYIFQLLTSHRWDHLFGLNPEMVLSGGAVWQIVTYMFLHADPLHLFWNMFILWMFGAELEMLWGSGRFIFYYILCGAGAGLVSIIVAPHAPSITVGASGAIFGLLLAFGLTYPNRPVAFMFVLPMKAKHFIFILAGLQLIFFTQNRAGPVAYAAHLGGLVTGALYFLIRSRGIYNLLGLFSGTSRKRPPHLKIVKKKEGSSDSADTTPEGIETSGAEIDRILDKISALGLKSLTERERTILEWASKNLERRKEDTD